MIQNKISNYSNKPGYALLDPLESLESQKMHLEQALRCEQYRAAESRAEWVANNRSTWLMMSYESGDDNHYSELGHRNSFNPGQPALKPQTSSRIQTSEAHVRVLHLKSQVKVLQKRISQLIKECEPDSNCLKRKIILKNHYPSKHLKKDHKHKEWD